LKSERRGYERGVERLIKERLEKVVNAEKACSSGETSHDCIV